MLFLHKNLGLLAGIAGDESRFALSAVRVLECREDWYRLEATDGKMLAIVCGPGAAGPGHDGALLVRRLEGQPDGAIEGLVPAHVWKKAFQGVSKGGRLAVLLAPDQATLATTETLTTSQLLEGRFPAIDQVLPRTPPLVKFAVNPDYLRDLLGLAAAIGGEDNRRVDLLYYGPGLPLGLMARNDQGQTLDALLMPLT